MRVYTSYFANSKNIPEDLAHVSIAAGIPKWFTGSAIKDVAPTYDILMEYKNGGDKETYVRNFTERIIKHTNPHLVYHKLAAIAHANCKEGVVLLCYETSDSFCHRHIVAKWLSENLNIEVNEL